MEAKLFNNGLEIGTFKGFTDGGLEFAAEIVSPYQSNELLTPRTGQLLLVELGTPEEAMLGRITRFVPVGTMAGPEGDEYMAQMSKLEREIPQQLKEDRLRYNVRVKLLGAIRVCVDDGNGGLRFIPSVRKLPHLGARVAYPTTDILSFLCSLGARNAQRDTPIGYYALGEVIYNGNQDAGEDYFVTMPEKIPVHFDVNNLVGKRSFVFARAGYGKSNLMKLLVAELYRSKPQVHFRDSNRPVGMLIFDPEGEYFWPDENGRPGLCDVPELRDQVAIFTNRTPPNKHYASWKVGDIRLNLTECDPGEIVRLCISEDKQENQNVIKLRTISKDKWVGVVNLFHNKSYNASNKDIRYLTGINDLADVECNGMKNNLIPIIHSLHDPDSNLQHNVYRLLRDGRIVIVDISLVSGRIGLQVAGLLLNDIFNHNQRYFTSPTKGGVIPVIAVLEEAQSVLGKTAKDESPFVQWTKEGRKYSLGSILVTQQPGSITPELLSQGDNFFAFHLLSEHDLKTLQFHNAHFSDDILAHLLNEPIRGNAYFWSAPHQPFVLPARIRNFEHEYRKYVATGSVLDKHIDTGLEDIISSTQKIIERLSGDAMEYIINGKVKIYDVKDHPEMMLIYKPNMSASLAKRMNDEERSQYCDDPENIYISDSVLEQILMMTGLFGHHIRRINCKRISDNKEGVFYRLDENCEVELIPREGVQLVSDLNR